MHPDAVSIGAGSRGRCGADNPAIGDDHHAEHIGVVVVLVVDTTKTNPGRQSGRGGEGLNNPVNRAEAKFAFDRTGLLAAAEDTVVEGVLVLPLGVASTHLGMGPVDLVGLADDHVLAVLPS